MASEFPQLAFTQWLSNVVARLMRDDSQEEFLSHSVDFADLERRQRAMLRLRLHSQSW